MNDSPPFKHEEQAFRAYISRITQADTRGFDPIAMRGRYYAKRCWNCGCETWKEQDGVWRCQGFKCGKLRTWRLVGVTKGYFQENTRRHSGSRTVEQTAELGLAFKSLTLWELRAWWSYCALGSYKRSFHFCRETWPRREAGWSLLRTQRLVDQARDRSRPVLERKGLI